MKQHALRILWGLTAALVLALAWLWLTPTGQLRNTRWQAPAAQTADYAAMVPALPGLAPADTSRFVAMLERPLFSPTRRPAQAKAAAAEQAPSDSLAAARLLGAFQGAGDGGVILLIDGKPRRLRLHDSVDGWALTAVQERGATFARNGQSRTLQLPRAQLTSAPATPPPAPMAPSAAPPAPPVPPAPAAPVAPPPAPAHPAPAAGKPGAKALVPVFGGS